MKTLVIISLIVNFIFIGGCYISTKISEANRKKEIVNYDYK